MKSNRALGKSENLEGQFVIQDLFKEIVQAYLVSDLNVQSVDTVVVVCQKSRGKGGNRPPCPLVPTVLQSIHLFIQQKVMV